MIPCRGPEEGNLMLIVRAFAGLAFLMAVIGTTLFI
jgi:hypothetical protein